MSKSVLEADYVIIGAGAPSMAIADTLLNESDSTVIMVDRRHKPGGHWNDSYPFVRLHGPSIMYGVNSRPLGEDRIDSTGLNKGLLELASGSEICAYFDDVMRHVFQPTGRFTYLPMHYYLESGEAVSLVNGEKVSIKAKKKTFHVMIGGDIPACTPPSFKVTENATCMPPNGLVNLPGVPECFAIIGGGKTAVDTIVWLLERGANPESITWIRPRDSWFVNRRGLQFHEAFFEQSIGWLVADMEAAASAKTVDDIFLQLEQAGYMSRIDNSVMPSMFRCAIISDAELEQLKRVNKVIRMGHVHSVQRGKAILEGGVLDLPEGTLFINCSADGIPRQERETIFQDAQIFPEMVRFCQPCYSGAFIAKTELMLSSDEEKNALCQPVHTPNEPVHWLTQQITTVQNNVACDQYPWIQTWNAESRLEPISKLFASAHESGDPDKLALLDRLHQSVPPAMENMEKLLAANAS